MFQVGEVSVNKYGIYHRTAGISNLETQIPHAVWMGGAALGSSEERFYRVYQKDLKILTNPVC
jgi:hypothetical protein